MTVAAGWVGGTLPTLTCPPNSESPLTAALAQALTAADGLFQPAATGLMAFSDNRELRQVASTDPRVELLAQAHLDVNEGPCLDSLDRGGVVFSGDLGEDRRWPAMAEVAASSGLGAVLVAPMATGARPVGILAVLSDAGRCWSNTETRAAVSVAQLTTALLTATRRVTESERRAVQLQHALDARIVIEQAKGILAERHGLAPKQTYDRLRSRARNERRPVAELAREVVQQSARCRGTRHPAPGSESAGGGGRSRPQG